MPVFNEEMSRLAFPSIKLTSVCIVISPKRFEIIISPSFTFKDDWRNKSVEAGFGKTEKEFFALFSATDTVRQLELRNPDNSLT